MKFVRSGEPNDAIWGFYSVGAWNCLFLTCVVLPIARCSTLLCLHVISGCNSSHSYSYCFSGTCSLGMFVFISLPFADRFKFSFSYHWWKRYGKQKTFFSVCCRYHKCCTVLVLKIWNFSDGMVFDTRKFLVFAYMWTVLTKNLMWPIMLIQNHIFWRYAVLRNVLHSQIPGGLNVRVLPLTSHSCSGTSENLLEMNSYSIIL